MITHEEIIITKYETEFVAKHKDFEVIGVGSNEFEAVLELSKALGALTFSKEAEHKAYELADYYKDLLLELMNLYGDDLYAKNPSKWSEIGKLFPKGTIL